MKNISKFKILFRCDAGDIPELGTGHLYRSLNIAFFLKKKFNLKKNDICFITKTQGKFSKGLEILRKSKFSFISLNHKTKNNSIDEIKFLKRFDSKMIIIDRLGKINSNFANFISKKFDKKIILEDTSNFRNKFDLSINSLIRNVPKNKKARIGIKYLILKIPNIKNFNFSEKNIFLFFGGYDYKNLNTKVINILNKYPIKLNLYIPEIYKKNINSKHKIIKFSMQKYYYYLYKSNVAIISGGLTLFDSILAEKKIICIPQYKHQLYNANILKKKNTIELFSKLDKKNQLNLFKVFEKIYTNINYKKKINGRQKKILNKNMILKNYNLITRIYEKTIN